MLGRCDQLWEQQRRALSQWSTRESTRGSDPSGVALRRLAVWTPGSRCPHLDRDAYERIASDEHFAHLSGSARRRSSTPLSRPVASSPVSLSVDPQRRAYLDPAQLRRGQRNHSARGEGLPPAESSITDCNWVNPF